MLACVASLRCVRIARALHQHAAPPAPQHAAPPAQQQRHSSCNSAREAGAGGNEQQEEKPERGDDTVAGKAASALDDAAGDAVSQLHPALVNFLNSGYLVSQGELRQRLMAVEWERNMRPLAMRKGLATFEQWLAERGPSEGLEVSWEVMQKLYERPDDLSPLRDNPRARLLAHALIQHAMLDQQLKTYRACSDTAKDLANVVESGQRTGITTLAAGLRRLLPWPFK